MLTPFIKRQLVLFGILTVITAVALGGYYLVEARDLDQALQIAKLCPAPNGGVELRPIMDTSGA